MHDRSNNGGPASGVGTAPRVDAPPPIIADGSRLERHEELGDDRLPAREAATRLDGQPDGRLERRRRNRTAVVDTYLAALADGEEEPTYELLASRSGVSQRSVFRYFESRTSLLAAAAQRLVELLEPMLNLPVDPRHDLPARMEAFVSMHVAAFEAHGVAASRVFARECDVDTDDIARFRARARDRLIIHFQRELALGASDSQSVRAELIGLAFQFESMALLSRASESSRTSLSEQLMSALRLHFHAGN